MNYLNQIIRVLESNNIPEKKDNTLYITDDPSISIMLHENGYPVVGWNHPETNTIQVSWSDYPEIKYILEDIDDIDDEDYERIYRRLKKLPCDILETEHLLLRETTVSDVDTLINLYSDPIITKYMENLFPLEEEKKYQQNYIDYVYSFYDIGIWSIIRKEDNALIGRMGIEIKDDSDSVELGFMLGTNYQHNGYATEAGLAIIEYAKELHYIRAIKAHVHPENNASKLLCLRLGMQQIDENTWIIRL